MRPTPGACYPHPIENRESQIENPAMLSLTSVTKRFGALTAVDGISLDLARGEFFGLLGPNGAGKSTTMALIAGLTAPDAGTLTLDGQPLTARHAATRTALGLVPQHLALYPELNAVENLRIFGELYGLHGADLRTRIAAALEAVQLADRAKEPVKNFSGGMQRRLNLVAALLHRPKLLLCDEPTVGVDPQSRNAIFDYLEQLNREGLTIIYSTHYMEEATRLCSRIGIIDHGRLHALGTLDELLTRLPFEEEIRFPATPATIDFAAQLAAHGELTVEDDVRRFRPHPAFPLSAFYALAESHALPGRLFTMQRPTLEAVFLHLTGRTLRE
ncbi:MAG: ABC transporter ATP-binding protein [Verrucomicrobia bacterium]|nr:ABC transporter ATP-binding protein [Verrucomicrobiota bacterium]